MSRKPKSRKMSQQNLYLNEVGPRCAWWLRSAWSGSRAKNLANLLEISEPQAKRLLGGARPTSEQLAKMARHWGWRFVNFVFEPAVGTPAMYADMQAFDARLTRLEAEREAEDARGALAIAGTASAGGGARASLGGADEEEAHQVVRAAGRAPRQ